MSREILIHVGDGEKSVAIIQDGKLEDFHIEAEHHQSILGNVYKGKVESILPSINGAFVNIGQERNGFLYLTDAVNPLMEEELSGPRKLINKILNKPEKEAEPKPRKDHTPPQLSIGQEILVQVVKDPFANKGARLTTHISLAGRFVVFMPYDDHHGVSRRIEDPQERQRLKEVLKEFEFVKTGGFIVRTVSLEKGKRELLRDARFLHKIWLQLSKLGEKSSAPTLLYEEYDLVLRVVRDHLTEEVDKVFIDSEDDCQRMRKAVENLMEREMADKIQVYKGHVPLYEAKGVSKELEKIYDSRIYLKSGAHIVIEPTEGLTVVDVNSGKFKTRSSPEDAAFMVNMEAAPEIARQLRLRDVGGIIVIDFIDMMKEGHKRKVLETLQDALTEDRAKTEVNRISQLGLVEMTRARTGNTIEAISFIPCPYCDGRGRVRMGKHVQQQPEPRNGHHHREQRERPPHQEGGEKRPHQDRGGRPRHDRERPHHDRQRPQQDRERPPQDREKSPQDAERPQQDRPAQQQNQQNRHRHHPRRHDRGRDRRQNQERPAAAAPEVVAPPPPQEPSA